MRILINATTVVKGGGIQVAKSFIEEVLELKSGNDYIICLTESVYSVLNRNVVGAHQIIRLKSSPSKLYTRKKITDRLNDIVNNYKVDAVYTVFGPSYWRPQVLHICGFGDGWCLFLDSPAFKILTLSEKIKRRILSRYKLYWLQKSSDHVVVETKTAADALAKVSGFDVTQISVVSNTYNGIVFADKNYIDNEIANYRGKLTSSEQESFKLVCIAAYKKHKNLESIRKVLELLDERYNVTFLLTLEENVFLENFGDIKGVRNFGPIHPKDCPVLYELADAVFVPTLIEIFTANYPEAMAAGRPILTSDLPFAHDLCEDAALYFDPFESTSIMKEIVKIIDDKRIAHNLIENGRKRLQTFPSSQQRALDYLNIIETQYAHSK